MPWKGITKKVEYSESHSMPKKGIRKPFHAFKRNQKANKFSLYYQFLTGHSWSICLNGCIVFQVK
jgi:hypothetical protein